MNAPEVEVKVSFDPPAAGVLLEVLEERHRQDQKWGEQNHPSVEEYQFRIHDTEAPSEFYGLPTQAEAKALCELAFEQGRPTWGHVLVEELCEALDAENDDERRAELVQLAAVAVAQIECIDRRKLLRAEG